MSEKRKPLPGRKAKLFLAALAGFALSFTLVLAGILDVYAGNHMQIPLDFGAVLLIAGLTMLIFWGAAFFLLLCLPRKIFPYAVGLALGLLVAAWLQGMFLNPRLGELTGDAVAWQEHIGQMIWGTALWLALLAAPLVLYRFASAKAWTNAVIIACALICGMQGAALVGNVISTGAAASKSASAYLSAEGNYTLSAQSNVIVFVIDRLDADYIRAVRDDDPAFFDRLDGFTEFTDATSLYIQTYPSVTYMITGLINTFEKSRETYFDEAWGGSDFLSLLRDNNYAAQYHISRYFTYTDARQLEGRADNLVSEEIQADRVQSGKTFLNLILYRCAPMIAKPLFWMGSVDFPYDVESGTPVVDDDPLFYSRLTENGLTVRDGENRYLFIHLNGSHAPYTMDELAQRSDDTGLVRQTKGCFHILYEYMDRMKALGLYKDATIVITADHGKARDFYQLDAPSAIGFFVKPRGAEGTPPARNHAPVSHENLLPTILKSEGLDYAPFGVSAFDVPEGSDVVRRFYHRYDVWEGDTFIEHRVEVFEIQGHAGDFSNWRKIDDRTAVTMRPLWMRDG